MFLAAVRPVGHTSLQPWIRLVQHCLVPQKQLHLSSRCNFKPAMKKKRQPWKSKMSAASLTPVIVDQYLEETSVINPLVNHSEENKNDSNSTLELEELRHGIGMSVRELGVEGPSLDEHAGIASSSDVPCPGCGATLHCTDVTSPGYISPPRYHSVSPHKLKEAGLYCQRCVLMNSHNIALEAAVSAEDYASILAQVKDVKALVVIVVDLLDMPNSLYRLLPQLVGRRRPVYVVGNKVDMLPMYSRDCLGRVAAMLEQACWDCGLAQQMYIKHMALISARTGYGVEDLVSKLMQQWKRKGQVFLMGCTNAGKSTLFNALLQSDYCKSVTRDFFLRATVSQWPGTTLNLLKFPIINATPSHVRERAARLAAEAGLSDAEMIAKFQPGITKKSILTGKVGLTFLSSTQVTVDKHHETGDGLMVPSYTFSPDRLGQAEEGLSKQQLREKVKDETRKSFSKEVREEKHARWCYDTPGVVNPDQVINLLTQRELFKLLPQLMIKPRTVVLKPGQVLFVSGIGRIDYVQGSNSIYFTAFVSQKIPLFVQDYDKADQFYRENVGKPSLAIPHGDSERLLSLPSLVGKEMTVSGTGWTESAADIVLSSLGWVAVTAEHNMDVVLRAYTPGLRGCHLRQPSVFCHAVNYRGKRMRNSAGYKQPRQRKSKKNLKLTSKVP